MPTAIVDHSLNGSQPGGRRPVPEGEQIEEGLSPNCETPLSPFGYGKRKREGEGRDGGGERCLGWGR